MLTDPYGDAHAQTALPILIDDLSVFGIRPSVEASPPISRKRCAWCYAEENGSMTGYDAKSPTSSICPKHKKNTRGTITTIRSLKQ